MKTRLFVLKNIKKYTKDIKCSIIGLILVSLLAIPITLISPRFFQILVDDVMCNGENKKMIIVIVGLFSVYLLRVVNDGISLILENRILNKFTYSIRQDIFKKIFGAPFAYIEKKHIGELKMRMIDDVDSLGNFIKEQIVNYISSTLTIIAIGYISFKISLCMTIACLTIIPFVYLINYWISVGTKKINEEIRIVNSEYYTSTYNTLQFWREIKTQNSEKDFIKRFKVYRSALAKLGIKYIRYWAYSEVFKDFKVNYLTKVFVYIIGTIFVVKQEISVGTLILFSEYYTILFTALDDLNMKRTALNINEPYYKRIFSTFSFPKENVEKRQISKFSNNITIRNLNFSYIDKRPVLKNINLKIDKGTYVAVVGKTGCGKTTLIKLLLGLYKPNAGSILYDDININELNLKGLYGLIGIVMQDNFLFNMSIRENLLLANENASELDLINACKKANIYDFIMSLPEKFESKIGEHGVKLSGGQRQRISIAAALLKNPKLLIFDEATSSLDKSSEDVINDFIDEISKDLTVIVVTHKLETAIKAQKVIVMENGEIVEIVSQEQLLNKREFYAKLLEVISNEKRE